MIEEQKLPIDTVVGVSTDKACKPVNVMGMTKAIQERVFIQANMRCHKTRFICVRYGNVLASRGSVIPLFHDQINRGGPVTITTSDMTRFLLSLDQAVDTIFAAVATGNRGETYIPRVPSAKMMDIAKALIDDRSIEVVITGIRPGEKIHEILVSEEECGRTVDRGNFYAILPILPEIRSSEDYKFPLIGEYSSVSDLLNFDQVKQLLMKRTINDWSGFIRKPGIIAVKILTVLGTRPEIIRLSRIISALDKLSTHILVHTGQNYDQNLNDIFFQQMGVRAPDHYLGARGSIGEQTGIIFSKIQEILEKEKPDRFLVLGDTNSALSAFIAKRMGIKVYHMEAGNRCYDDRVPEEVNRKVIDHSSDILMPYTERSRKNLLLEGFEGHRVFVTGNPIYEVLSHYESEILKSTILSKLKCNPQSFFPGYYASCRKCGY